MILRDDAREKITEALRSVAEHLREKKLCPTIGWAYNRKEGVDNDPGPIIAFYTESQMGELNLPSLMCHEFRLFWIFPKDVSAKYSEVVLGVSHENLAFVAS